MAARRRLAAVAIATPLAAATTRATPAAPGHQTTTTLVPVDDQPQRRPSIIPIPGATAPEIQGDPGTGTQYAVFGIVIGGLALVGLGIARESRRNRDRRTPTPPPAT